LRGDLIEFKKPKSSSAHHVALTEGGYDLVRDQAELPPRASS
jgi:hypothetical protein